MHLPAIAVRTFNQFKDEEPFRKLLKYIFRKLDKIKDPVKRSNYVHKKIDEEIKNQFKDPSIQKLTQCKKGCSACCHSQVAVTQDEVHLLADLVQKGKAINWTRLWVQAKVGTNTNEFMNIAYEMRGCVFLNSKGECSVYDSRPSVCRTNYVVSDPVSCRVEAGEVKSVQLLNTYGADSWIYAFFMKNKENGVLASMLKRELEKRSKNTKEKRREFPTLDA